jgi:STE24 endopeptidase
LALFFAGLCVIAIVAIVVLRRLAMSGSSRTLHGRAVVVRRVVVGAQMLVVAWFGFGVSALGWPAAVAEMTAPIAAVSPWILLPQVVVGTLPAYLALLAVMVGQYAVDRAVREQAVVYQLAENLPVRMPVGFGRYFVQKMRMQVLFVLAPVLIAMGVVDGLNVAWHALPWALPAGARELVVTGVAVVVTLLAAPHVLTRVLETVPFGGRAAVDGGEAGGGLVERLTEMTRRAAVGWPRLLLWRTDGMVANAAAMGVWPGRRYVLMSDLLLETMTDEQLQAVFAHELGHIAHRHVVWLMMFFLAMGLGSAAVFGGVEAGVWAWCRWMGWRPEEAEGVLRGLSVGWGAVSVVGMVLGFGWVSRRFELEADAFGARAVGHMGATESAADLPGGATLAPMGALRMASALNRIGVVNNLALDARNFTHGSLAWRIGHLQKLSASEEFAARFEKQTARVRWGIWGGLVMSVAGLCLLLLA